MAEEKLYFANWHMVREIGEGSFGHVYEIAREEFGVTYRAAMKIISLPRNEQDVESLRASGMSEDEIRSYYSQFVQDMAGEISMMSRLKGQSHIVSYEDHAVIPHEDGIGADIQIRMELLTPLLTYTRRHVLTQRDVVKLGCDMCRALELCRRHAIIHRDIKPENIFVTENGDFKLGDFGVARQAERTSQGFSVRGTFSYMAPEVYRGEEYGPTVDGYSLGLVLYRFLNDGRMPFMPPYPEKMEYGDNEKAARRRLSGETLPPPCHAGKHLSRVVLKACAVSAQDRYQSPEEMRKALEEVPARELDVFAQATMAYTDYSQLTGMEPPPQPSTVVSPPPQEVPKTPSAPPTPKKNRVVWVVGITAVVLALMFVGVWIFALTRPVPVQEVRFSSGDLVLERGETAELKVEILPENATDPTVQYQSDNDKILTVDESGQIMALTPGTVEVTVTSGDCSATCTVQVVVSAQTLTLSDSELTLAPGEETRLTASVSPVDTTDEVSYRVDNAAVLQVEEDGTLRALAQGEAIITATCGALQQSCHVTIEIPVESITLSQDEIFLDTFGEQTLTATVMPDNATQSMVTFTSSDPDVVIVSEEGKIQAQSGGVAEITASAGGKEAVCVVRVSGTVTSEQEDGTKVVKEYSRWGIVKKETETSPDGVETVTEYDEQSGEKISRTVRQADGSLFYETFGEKPETFTYDSEGNLTSHTVNGEEVPLEEAPWWEQLWHNWFG